MGKILVMNSLVNSLFIYAMQVLIDPEPMFYVSLEQIIETFIGDKKKVKNKTAEVAGKQK